MNDSYWNRPAKVFVKDATGNPAVREAAAGSLKRLVDLALANNPADVRRLVIRTDDGTETFDDREILDLGRMVGRPPL